MKKIVELNPYQNENKFLMSKVCKEKIINLILLGIA